MRDGLNNCKLVPIAQDSMNDVAYSPTVRSLSNISSNGYYGYQPPPIDKQQQQPEAEASRDMGDVEMCFVGETVLETDPGRFVNRKRTWDCTNEFREFKKRRQNEKIDGNARKKGTNAERKLYEDLLEGTHGCSIYHWINK